MLGLINTVLAKSGITKEVYTDGFSLEFDGVGDSLETSYNYTSVFQNSFTVSLWAKIPDGQPAGQRSFIQLAGGNNGSFIFDLQANGKLAVLFATAGTAYLTNASSVTFANGAIGWKHLAVTFTKNTGSNTTFAVYVDGSAISMSGIAVSEADHSAFSPLSANTLRLGGTVAPYVGHLNDFGIFNTDLAANAITEIYNSGDPADLKTDTGNYNNSSNLVGYWKLEENTGTTAFDSVGVNHGTFLGDPQWDNDVP